MENASPEPVCLKETAYSVEKPKADPDRILDNPVHSPEEDEFNRWPFSKRLADTIANFDARGGAPVIGVYGRWGYGKSTVLNFIREQLQRSHRERTEIFEFNPWRFKDQEALASAFFQGLAITVDRTLGGTGQRVGQILEYGSSLLSVIPLGGGAAANLVEKFGAQLAHQSLEAERRTIIEIMRSAERKIVVLIDDIDRLDRDEILAILKLVRLTANFPQIVYVLAFDDDMVAQAVGYSFGGAADSGRQFVEKIVQHPFTIPAVSRQRLLTFIERRALGACAKAGIRLDDKEWRQFRGLAEDCLLPRLVTPRQAIRYGNALAFALPMLTGEVNTLDQILVEGLRVLFPALYTFVRDNGPTFVVEDAPFGPTRVRSLTRAFGGVALDALRLKDIAAKVMEDADEAQQNAGSNLLRALFGDPGRPRSVALARYFDRYFSYTVDPEDISDAELAEFRELCEGGEDEKPTDLHTSLVKRNAPVLIARLRAIAGQQSRDLTERMVRILVKNGQLFVPTGTGLNDGLSAQSAMLVAELILNCPGDSEQLASVARQTVDQAQPLTFALLIYQELAGTEFKNRTMLGKSDALLAETAIVDLRTALVNRISQAALQRPIYEEFAPADALSLLILWHYDQSPDVNSYLCARVKSHPVEAYELLNLFKDSGWSSFQLLTNMVDVDVLTNALKAHFAPIINEGKWTEEISLFSSFSSFLKVKERFAQNPTSANG